MYPLPRFVLDFLKKEDGPTAVEYAVMLALILLVVYTAVQFVGTTACKTFSSPAISSAIGSGT
jgi:pilus assembly protein Flp/PilA